jgi:hypothetical protein
MDIRPSLSLVKRHSRNGKTKAERRRIKVEEVEKVLESRQRRRYGYSVNDATLKTTKTAVAREERVESSWQNSKDVWGEAVWVEVRSS